nr:cytochrome p450 97b3, chloroplastic [Quercus suber]
MAPGIPAPALLLLVTAAESAVAIVALKQHLPEHPLVYVFSRLLGLQVLIYLIYKIFIYPFYLNPLRDLPGPSGALPILGHGLSMFERPQGSEFARWMKVVPNDGLIHFRGFFNASRLLVTDPKALGELPEPVRNFLRNILGDGLIIVEGDDHKFLRKNCMPSFSFRHIKELYPIFWDKSTQLVEGVAQQIKDKPEIDADGKTGVVEVNHWANMVTMDIIGMAAMGRDFRTMRSGQDPLIENYEELLEPTREKQIYFAANILGPSPIIRKLPWRMNETSKRIETNLARICIELVREKKQAMKTESDSHKDILSLLIRTNNFSDRQLADQLLTFLAAGHETTSSAFTWTTYLLAANPDIQTALRAEIHVTYPLPYRARRRRLRPRDHPRKPPAAQRSVQRDAAPLPDGTHHDAERFVPERWIDTDPTSGERKPNNAGGAPSNYANLTFLHGPRSCIGQGFAKAELRALVAAFVGSFDMSLANPDEEVIPSGVVTTKPKNGMNLRLKRLGGW